jgi:hypothetical protein
MSYLKLTGGAGVMFVAVMMLVASAAAARAETIFLKCGPMNVITVDLTNQTVNNKPANITPVAIDWQSANQYGESRFHIDRTTGILTTSGTYFTSNGNIPMPQGNDPCTVVSPSKQF